MILFHRFSFDSVHAVCGLAGILGVRDRSLCIQNFSLYPSTPLFMPPERIVNFKYVKPVSDVWSFAATLPPLCKFPANPALLTCDAPHNSPAFEKWIIPR
jgi:serine/threonine protein kinase